MKGGGQKYKKSTSKVFQVVTDTHLVLFALTSADVAKNKYKLI